MKKLFIVAFSYTTFAIPLNKENVSETSSKNKIIEIKKFYNSSHKDSENGRTLKKNHLLKSFENFVTKETKYISSQDINEEKELIGRFVSELLTLTLKEENIFLLYDRELMNHYKWFEFILYENLKHKPHITQVIQDLDVSIYHNEILSGYKYTILCLIYNASLLSELFLNKTIDYKWAPGKLLIVNLDQQRAISEEIFNSTIQRSNYIFISELRQKKKELVFQTYSILPFQRNETGLSQWKIFTGIYTSPRKINKILLERNKKFGGRKLHVASICFNFPLLYLDKNGNCIGVNFEILSIIGKDLNFTFTVQMVAKDGLWGAVSNNKVTGMYKDLHDNGKDLIINGHHLDYNLQPYFEPSIPYHYENFAFLGLIPGLIPTWKQLFLSFSLSLWNILMITIVAMILAAFLMIKFDFRTKNDSSLSTSFLLVSES